MLVSTGPYVQLGMMHDDSLVAAIVNTVQAIKSVDVALELAQKVDIEGVNAAFTRGLAEQLGGGPPFAYTESEDSPLLQVEVLDYGLDVPSLGAPGAFTYNLRGRIYDESGERVYTVLHSCATAVGSPDPAAQVLLTVNNIAELQQMSASEVQAAFEGAAYYCGVGFVARMRKHAG